MRIATVTTFMIVFWQLIAGPAFGQQKHESPHKALQRSCEKCHVATSFKDIRFDHEETGYRLGGNHGDLACLQCHNIEDFSKVEAACATCHQDVHQRSMGATCERCHSVDGWTTFDGEEIHATTNFPLLGRHVIVGCESCHSGMVLAAFRRTPTTCIGCHRLEYEATTNPNHRTGGFAAECEQCHQLTAWTPAVMGDHDSFFPIFSGRHNRVWDTCAQCHTNPGNSSVVSCLTCHEHAQNLMDTSHNGFPGYSYTTPSCLSCHPTGEAGTFVDHDAQFFPIFSGKHRGEWNSCATCHQGPSNASFTCFACHQHDRTSMDDKHKEMNGYTYDSVTCLSCHADGRK